jgi:hypothetical protein
MMVRHVLSLTGLAALLLLPRLAAGQDVPPSPRVELGFDGSIGSADAAGSDVRPNWGPRVTFHLTRDVSLAVASDLARSRRNGRGPWDEAQSVSVELRRAMVQRGRLAFDLIAGTGVQRHESFWPGFIYTATPTPIVVNDARIVETSALADFGVGLRQHLGKYVTLREDALVRLAASGEFRARFGVDIPLGGRTIDATRETARYGSARLGAGERVWLDLADRSQVEGRIERISADRIELLTAAGRRSIAASEIDRIDIQDSVKNGTLIGGAIGAAGGVVLIAIAATVLCEGECDDDQHALMALAGGFWGFGAGALAGALGDALHVGQRTVYRRGQSTSLTIAPVLARRGVGIGAALGW